MPHDGLYLPVHAGAANTEAIEGFQPDNEGENISAFNPYYCELTALYWAWRNLGPNCDALGLAHYRRHFKGAGERGTLTAAEAEELLAQAPLVLPNKRHYVIETLASHFVHTSNAHDLEVMRGVLKERAPAYAATYEKVLARRSGHMFNIFIARRDVADAYCSWLFPVLSEVDARLGHDFPNAWAARAVGRLAEQLLDVWVEVEQVPFVERALVEFDIDWPAKTRAFLEAKFLGRPYG